jgi:hypothetical protein
VTLRPHRLTVFSGTPRPHPGLPIFRSLLITSRCARHLLLCFHIHTNSFSRNPFIFTSMQFAGCRPSEARTPQVIRFQLNTKTVAGLLSAKQPEIRRHSRLCARTPDQIYSSLCTLRRKLSRRSRISPSRLRQGPPRSPARLAGRGKRRCGENGEPGANKVAAVGCSETHAVSIQQGQHAY